MRLREAAIAAVGVVGIVAGGTHIIKEARQRVISPAQIDGASEINCAQNSSDSYYLRQSLPTGRSVGFAGGNNVFGNYLPDVVIRSTNGGGLLITTLEGVQLDKPVSYSPDSVNRFNFMQEGVYYDISADTSSQRAPIVDINISCDVN